MTFTESPRTPHLKIAIVGGGYVGLVTAAGLASHGHKVTVMEVEEGRLKELEAGRLPIREPGLEALWSKAVEGGLRVAHPKEGGYRAAELMIVCVGTPTREDGTQDLAHIKGAAADIGEGLRDSHGYAVVAIKSTVLPGTTEGVVRPILERASGRRAGPDFGLAAVPEFLAQGSAVQDFLHPNRIVIGGLDKASAEVLLRAFAKLPGPRMVTDLGTAEMIKYASNAFLASRISLTNEIANLCKAQGLDTLQVLEAVGMDDRIGPKFLRPGVGFGGSCFAKDVQALTARATSIGVIPRMLRATIEVNEDQPLRLVGLLDQKLGGVKGRRIALLGLAFKPGTDDIRESRGLVIASLLRRAGAHVVAFDPEAVPSARAASPDLEYASDARKCLAGAEACVIATEWPEFSRLRNEFGAMKRPLVVDGRRGLDPVGLGIEYVGLCW